jgi:hypothetical protein
VESRLRIDLFAFALGALALLSVLFLSTRNGAALVMCGLCFAGLITARAIGFSNRALVPVAIGLVLILWMVWIDPPTTSRRVTTLAHAAGGALVGWALSEYLRGRLRWPDWGKAAIVAVLALTVLWEAGELVGDTLLGTALQPDAADSVLDIAFGVAGGSFAVALALLATPRAARDRRPVAESRGYRG